MIFLVLGLISAGGMMIMLVSLVYGVNPLEATTLFHQDVRRCLLIVPWIFLAFVCTRWISGAARRLYAVAYRQPTPAGANTLFLEVALAALVASTCVYAVHFIEDLM